jgi:imidazolonepropionase
MPRNLQNNLAVFIDVFCETGYFTVEETEEIMNAGIHFGLKPKIHVNQFNSIGDSSRGKHKGVVSGSS